MSYLLRLVLPDRPGALGAVASALGRVGADILSLDVVDRSPGRATDDLVVELPPERLADSLVSAAATVPGVQVESIRPYADQIDPYRELELLENIAAAPADALALLADGTTRIFRAGWALVLAEPAERTALVVATSGPAAPEITTLPVPWWPPRPARELDPDPGWAPTGWERLGIEVAVAPLAAGALLVGRPAVRWLPSELVRLQHLTSVASTVTTA